MNTMEQAKKAYSIISELWCSPADVDIPALRAALQQLIQEPGFPEECAAFASQFLAANQLAEEDYIEMFELDPACSLYLGSHSYDEPKTCAGGAVSDRNEYMLELQAMYRHFGLDLEGRELADYLPVMIDFIGASIEQHKDPVRTKLIRDYFLPFLPPVLKKLEEVNTAYWYLLTAAEKLVRYDLATFEPGDPETMSKKDTIQQKEYLTQQTI